MTPPLAHWDDVEVHDRDIGEVSSLWQALGAAAGAERVGLNRIRVRPGRRSTPVHTHGACEETVFVLAGDGLLWQDGATCRVGPGDCVVHRPFAGDHTLIAGEEELDVLAFGAHGEAEFGSLPRAGVLRFRGDWVELGGGATPDEREAAAGPLEVPEPGARPENVVALTDAEISFGGVMRALGRSAGARRSGLNHVTLPPGAVGAPAHCHSAEEELFVVVDGEATLLLHPRGGGPPDEHALRRGHVVARPPGTGVAHALRAGPEGCVYLAFGTREPSDTTYYPETRLVRLRGLGVEFRLPDEPQASA